MGSSFLIIFYIYMGQWPILTHHFGGLGDFIVCFGVFFWGGDSFITFLAYFLFQWALEWFCHIPYFLNAIGKELLIYVLI